METFTPYSALLGGALIGLVAACMLYINGRVCGVSGMVSDFVLFHANLRWSGFFLFGLFLGGLSLRVLYPYALDIEIPLPYPVIVFGGMCVGFGSRMGGGCTSGHGVCGVGLIQRRSVVATLVFLGVGILTATLLYHFVIGDPRP